MYGVAEVYMHHATEKKGMSNTQKAVVSQPSMRFSLRRRHYLVWAVDSEPQTETPWRIQRVAPQIMGSISPMV